MSKNTAPTDEIDGWHERARELREHGGEPERRAEVVALREQGLSYSEIAAELDINRGGAARHIRRYKARYADARELGERGPDPDDL